MEERHADSLRRKETVLKSEQKEDFHIPPKKHPWLIRAVIGLAVIVMVVGVGLGAYWYQRPSDLPNASKGSESKTTEIRSVESTDESDIDSDAKAAIDDVDMAASVTKEFEPITPTTKFAPDAEKIFVTIQTKNLSSARQLKAEWYYVEDDTFIDEVVYGAEKGINNVAFHLERPASGFWPEGEYQIKIYVDGSLAQIARFDVQEDTEKTVDTQENNE